MMGHRQVEQAALFYEFSLEKHIPADHLLRSIDKFVDLHEIKRDLAPFYSNIGRPSIDPELMIRMLLIGYCFGIRSERRLCEEVHLNLAYRWFCRLALDGAVPDHSTFSKNRHGRFRESDLLREVFETRGFVHKTDTERHLFAAIDALAGHQPYFTSTIADGAGRSKCPEQAAIKLTPTVRCRMSAMGRLRPGRFRR